MNVQTEMKSSRKYEKYLYVKSQYKVNFMNCRKCESCPLRVPCTLLPIYDEQERLFSWLDIGTTSKLQVEGLKRSDCWKQFQEKTELWISFLGERCLPLWPEAHHPRTQHWIFCSSKSGRRPWWWGIDGYQLLVQHHYQLPKGARWEVSWMDDKELSKIVFDSRWARKW